MHNIQEDESILLTVACCQSLDTGFISHILLHLKHSSGKNGQLSVPILGLKV